MKRILAVCMVLLISATAFTGCSSPSSSASSGKQSVSLTVETSFGASDGNRNNYVAAYTAYENATGNKIKDDSGGANGENWKLKVMNDFQVGSDPDVLFFFNGDDSNTLVKEKKVVSIDEIRKIYPDYANNMKDEMMGASPVDGKNYSVPANGYWESMFINKKVLSDSGVSVPDGNYTWDQFLKDCQAIKNKGYVPIALSLSEAPSQWFEFAVYNHDTADTHNTVPNTINDPAAQNWVAGLNDTKTLYEKGFFPKNTLDMTEAETIQQIVNNQAAFLIEGSWEVGYFEDNMKDDLANITVGNFPAANSGRKSTDIIGGISEGYFITTKAWNDPNKRKAAVDFVEAMTTDKVISQFCSSGGLNALKNPTTPSDSESSLKKSVDEMLGKVTGVSPAVQDKLDSQTVRAPFFGNFQKLVVGQMTAQQVVSQAIDAQNAFNKKTKG
jgi:raffinose/stachyose/melibiose transport system substrate-binding protein